MKEERIPIVSYIEEGMAYRWVFLHEELCENNRYSMRRMNSSWQGGGVSHSGAMSNDDNAAMADSDKQNEVIINAQFLSIEFSCCAGHSMVK